MNLNKAIVLGRITKDPEQRKLKEGKEISSFSIATNETWTDKESGEKQEKVEFHNIVAFGKLAEICNQYLEKGTLVLVEGGLQTKTWDDKEGVKKSRTEIVARNMQMGPKANKQKIEKNQAKTDDAEEVKVEDIPF